LAHLLFEGYGSVLYKELIESGIATNYCPGYGYDTTTKQATFTIGVEGILEKDIYKVHK
jgi:presequence protease